MSKFVDFEALETITGAMKNLAELMVQDAKVKNENGTHQIEIGDYDANYSDDDIISMWGEVLADYLDYATFEKDGKKYTANTGLIRSKDISVSESVLTLNWQEITE